MARGSERLKMSENSQEVISEASPTTTSVASEQVAEPDVIVKPHIRVGFVNRLLRRGSSPPPIDVLVARGESSGPTFPNPNVNRSESTSRGGSIPREVVEANASLSDQDRLRVAQENENIGALSEEQQQAVLKAHREGLGERGKDKTNLAGVYNYNREQTERKITILRQANLKPRQRHTLFELGLVGVLPSGNFDVKKFDVDTDYTDPTLKKIAIQIRETGKKGVRTSIL